MRARIALLLACLSAAVAAAAESAPARAWQPSAAVEGGSVVVRAGSQTLAAGLSDATLTLTGPAGKHVFRVSILHGKGWTSPQPAAGRPVIGAGKARAAVRITYPVPGEREFDLEVAAYAGVPAIFVTSRLARLRDAGSEYYYWSSDVTFDRYVAPADAGPADAAVDPAKWESLPWRPWLYLPAASGGVALLPTNVSGRTPGKEGTLFLHALPRSQLVEPGNPQVASFGLALAAKAEDAAALEAAARARHVPALSVSAAGPPAGVRPAPDWARRAEVYNLYYRPAAQWTDAVVNDRLRGFPFIIGSTPDKAALERCHKAGVRLLHYVTYTCLLDTAMQTREGGSVYSEWKESVGCDARDLKDHPDWVCIDADGKIEKDAWGQAHHHPGLLNTCLHQPGLQDAAVRQVRTLMEMGYDGIFVDLAGPTVECFGPQFGRHTHPDPNATNTQAWERLLARLYETVKSYGKDRLVVQNTCTGLLPSHWRTCDAQMLEAFPFGEDSAEVRASLPELEWTGRQCLQAAAHGKRVVILSYLPKVAPERAADAALYSFAYAQIYGCLWADAGTLLDRPETAPLARTLYALRLGPPAGGVQQAGDALFRRFQKGVALLNLGTRPAVVEVPVQENGDWQDVAHGGTVPPQGGKVRLELPPQSGRVLLMPR